MPFKKYFLTTASFFSVLSLSICNVSPNELLNNLFHSGRVVSKTTSNDVDFYIYRLNEQDENVLFNNKIKNNGVAPFLLKVENNSSDPVNFELKNEIFGSSLFSYSEVAGPLGLSKSFIAAPVITFTISSLFVSLLISSVSNNQILTAIDWLVSKPKLKIGAISLCAIPSIGILISSIYKNISNKKILYKYMKTQGSVNPNNSFNVLLFSGVEEIKNSPICIELSSQNIDRKLNIQL